MSSEKREAVLVTPYDTAEQFYLKELEKLFGQKIECPFYEKEHRVSEDLIKSCN